MEYLSVAQARSMPGIKLALSAHMPGPWGEAVKQMLMLKGLDFVPVAQIPSQENAELRAWTGCRNAPVLVTPDGACLHLWRDIIAWIDGQPSEPRVLPEGSADRLIALGLVNEIAGEGGFGWCRRLLTIEAMGALDGKVELGAPAVWREMVTSYRISAVGLGPARHRIADIFRLLAQRLHDQHRAGSRFFVGETLSVADIYWACFSLQVDPDVPLASPMNETIRTVYRLSHPELLAALDPILMAHRDHVLADHLRLPLDF